ncbi:MAG TPA: GDP-mannose 4,6-dehydratase [Stellaceae bacterium]|nr:GDP-mannose 4,6-dehydratase [Stellaceae bacterium]
MGPHDRIGACDGSVQNRPHHRYFPAKLGILDRVELHSATVTDFRSVVLAIREMQPSKIYNFPAQSSVGLSFIGRSMSRSTTRCSVRSISLSVAAMRAGRAFYGAGRQAPLGMAWSIA